MSNNNGSATLPPALDAPRKLKDTSPSDNAFTSEPALAPVPTEPAPASLKKRRAKPFVVTAILGIVAACGVAVGYPYLQHSLAYTDTDDAFIDSDIVTIAPHTSGYVVDLKVKDNQHVQAGELLAAVDPRDTSVRLRLAQAAQYVAENQYKQAQATVDEDVADVSQKQAQIDAALALKEFADTEAERLTNLPEAAASKTERQNSISHAKAAAAEVEAAKAALASAQAKVANAKAAVATAAAEVKAAEVGVEQEQLQASYTQITSPVAGRVTRRNVQLGSYVVTGQSLLAIVPDKQWVTANFKETQLDGMYVGQEVIVNVDAYPGHPLKGHIDSIQRGTGARFSLLPPENATGNFVKVVQRVPVKIAIDDPIPDDMVLAPGMSVVPEVKMK